MQSKLMVLRKEHNESQSEIAALIGLSLAGYQLKESGKHQFKANEMFKLAKHYKLPMEQIFLPTKYTG